MREVTVVSNDGRENMSLEVWRAFADAGTTVADGGSHPRVGVRTVDDDGGSGGALPEDDAKLSAEQMVALLNVSDWSLVIRLGRDDDEVLDRAELAAAAAADRERPARLRELNQDEAVALAAVVDGVAGTFGRLRAAKGLPLTTIGGAVAVVGAYGGAKANFTRPEYAVAAAVVGVLGVLLAGFLSNWRLGPDVVRLSRLDQVRTRYAALVDRGSMQSKLTVVLTGLMIVLLLLSVVLPANEEAPSLEIGTPAVTRHDDARTIELTVTGEHLARSVVRVHTTVSQRGEDLVADDSTTPSDGAVEDRVSADVPAAGDVEVRVVALDATGRQVDEGRSRVFRVE
jgi:hypothetical protein